MDLLSVYSSQECTVNLRNKIQPFYYTIGARSHLLHQRVLELQKINKTEQKESRSEFTEQLNAGFEKGVVRIIQIMTKNTMSQCQTRQTHLKGYLKVVFRRSLQEVVRHARRAALPPGQRPLHSFIAVS